MVRTFRSFCYYAVYAFVLVLDLFSAFLYCFHLLCRNLNKLWQILGKMYQQKTSGALKAVYAVICWGSIYGCYLKYREVYFVDKYSYITLLLPIIVISVIYLIESYFRMIKSAIDAQTGRNS